MKNIHIGVYGIHIINSKILLIKKSRGPYKGMFDLPGGSIEESEKILDCLKRELKEEVNGELISSDFLGFNEYHCDYVGSSGIKKPFHHIGFYYKVDMLISELKIESDGHDSLGAELIDIDLIKSLEIAPIAKTMIFKFF